MPHKSASALDNKERICDYLGTATNRGTASKDSERVNQPRQDASCGEMSRMRYHWRGYLVDHESRFTRTGVFADSHLRTKAATRLRDGQEHR